MSHALMHLSGGTDNYHINVLIESVLLAYFFAGAITSFNELQLGGCSCESCTCSKVMDATDCSESKLN